mmetsp:Transcript_33887/g.88203  ORF Transcript_33887/g.88203 Transcript_33887/m.88203 type:complete len:996 (+) Transcript_33887:71-3058(+)
MATNVKVAVRVRPFLPREQGEECVISMHEKTTTVTTAEQSKLFTFDHSYWSHDVADAHHVTQEMVHEDLGEPILASALQGYNNCLVAYGQTGSGKSHSVIGYEDEPGIIPRILDSLFRGRPQQGRTIANVWVSFLEIYNESVKDLLYAGKEDSGDLPVRDHPKFGTFVVGLTEAMVQSAGEVQQLMDYGTKRRVVGATNMNANSSRSHAVFCLKLEVHKGENTEKPVVMFSKTLLVDLAGSERQSKTATAGARLKEGCAINRSLSVLAMVIRSLADLASTEKKKSGAAKAGGGDFAPFRSSKLTYLLKDSLVGNSKTALIAAISPAASNAPETLSTLRFASSVKTIKTVAKVNMDSKDKMVLELKQQIAQLKSQMAEAGAHPEHSEQLEAHTHLLERMSMSREEHKQEAEHLARLRQEVVDNAGLSLECMEDAMGIGADSPYLANISNDATLSGQLVYMMRKGMPFTFGSSEENSVVLKGLGMPSHLCSFLNEDDTKVSVQAIEGGGSGRLVVNGAPVKDGPVQLHAMDRVAMGRVALLRVMVPLEADHQDPVIVAAAAMDFEACLAEIVQNSENSESLAQFEFYFEELEAKVGKRAVSDLIHQLHEICPLVDEANEISSQVRPNDRLKIDVDLLWDIHRNRVGDYIILRVLKELPDGPAVLAFWTSAKFLERVELMRNVFEEWHRNGDWTPATCSDPWVDPRYPEVHEAVYQLKKEAQERWAPTSGDGGAKSIQVAPGRAGFLPDLPVAAAEIVKPAARTPPVTPAPGPRRLGAAAGATARRGSPGRSASPPGRGNSAAKPAAKSIVRKRTPRAELAPGAATIATSSPGSAPAAASTVPQEDLTTLFPELSHATFDLGDACSMYESTSDLEELNSHLHTEAQMLAAELEKRQQEEQELQETLQGDLLLVQKKLKGTRSRAASPSAHLQAPKSMPILHREYQTGHFPFSFSTPVARPRTLLLIPSVRYVTRSAREHGFAYRSVRTPAWSYVDQGS